MPYKDPEKQKAAKRESARRLRAERGRERVVEASAEGVLPGPPAREELLRLLGVQARHGSVRAIELLLRMEADASVGRDPLGHLDELASRRSSRA